MTFALRPPRTQQPQGAVRLRCDHPLASVLDRAWLGANLAGIDLLSGVVAPPPSGATVNPRPEGLAINSTSSGTNVAIPTIGTYPLVMVAYGYFGATGSTWRLHGLTRAAGGNSTTLQFGTSNQVAMQHQGNGGTSRTVNVTLPSNLNTPILMIGVVYSSTDYRLFANGLQANGTLDAGTPHSLDRVRPPGEFLNGGVFFAGHGFGRALPDEVFLDITRHHERLWEAFEPRCIVLPVSAGVGVTLSSPGADQITLATARPYWTATV